MKTMDSYRDKFFKFSQLKKPMPTITGTVYDSDMEDKVNSLLPRVINILELADLCGHNRVAIPLKFRYSNKDCHISIPHHTNGEKHNHEYLYLQYCPKNEDGFSMHFGKNGAYEYLGESCGYKIINEWYTHPTVEAMKMFLDEFDDFEKDFYDYLDNFFEKKKIV